MKTQCYYDAEYLAETGQWCPVAVITPLRFCRPSTMFFADSFIVKDEHGDTYKVPADAMRFAKQEQKQKQEPEHAA